MSRLYMKCFAGYHIAVHMSNAWCSASALKRSGEEIRCAPLLSKLHLFVGTRTWELELRAALNAGVPAHLAKACLQCSVT